MSATTTEIGGGAPHHIEHLRPADGSAEAVQVSIVVPALNERVTVGEFVDWCRAGLRQAGVAGQILIVDSSTDDTPAIALAHGAEVLRVPQRGLGRAYIDAIPYIRGEWVIMGDADLTYDFRELAPFVERFRAGAEFVMGSRFNGTIEKGAMPGLHRYFGTPLTTWILNRIYRTRFSDIHCGMRGVTKAALLRIGLRSQSWEYASEMVLKAAMLGLRIAEVPVRFYKDREVRASHHRRAGWLSQWIAGWINLKVMLVYSPDRFTYLPGLILGGGGLALCGLLARGPVELGGVQLSLHSMLLGLVAATLGYGFVQLAVVARLMHGLRPHTTRRWQAVFSYDRGMAFSALGVAAGLALLLPFVSRYLTHGFRLETLSHTPILGLLLTIVGCQTFVFTLLIEMARRLEGKRDE